MTSDKYYLEPLGFLRGSVSSGAVTAGRSLPLAGGPLSFTSFGVTVRQTGGKARRRLVPVGEFDDFLATLSPGAARDLELLKQRLISARAPLTLPGGRTLDWQRPLIQGILNVTPDSFSDGGRHDRLEDALAHAGEMTASGADIIDIGGESTRPGAAQVSIAEELDRVIPVLEKLKRTEAVISVDTRNAAVMKESLAAGAHIINDVSALGHDPLAVAVVRESAAPVILMHARGTPETMQENPVYDDVLLDVYDYLEERIAFCLEQGLSRDRLIVDPGIGFGKTVDHNAALLQGLGLFHALGVPVLLGASRKRFIAAMSRNGEASQRLAGSLAAAQTAFDAGVQIVRVHDVPETAQLLDVWSYIGKI